MWEIGLLFPINDKSSFISKTLDNAPLENNEESENPIDNECWKLYNSLITFCSSLGWESCN